MKKIIWILLGLIVNLVACSDNESPTTGSGEVTFTMPLRMAKTAAGIQIDSVRVKFTGPTVKSGKLTISPDSSTASGTFNNLAPGDYTITINAFADHIKVATGSGNATVYPGQITNTSIALSYVNGSIAVNVTWAVAQPIVFVDTVSGINQICSINSDGSNFTVLTSFSVHYPSLGKPAYSPDGGLIAFYLNDGTGLNIWLMNADGSDMMQVTNNNEAYIGERPEFSTASDTIYYRRTTGPGAASIWKTAIDGSGDGPYFDFPGNEYMIELAGSFLYYFVHGGGLYKTNSLSDLSSGLLVSGAQFPAVTNDFSKLVYIGLGSTWDKITVANLDATSPLIVSDESGRFCNSVSFTKNGQSVVYYVQDSIRIVGVDGSGLKTVRHGYDPMAKPN